MQQLPPQDDLSPMLPQEGRLSGREPSLSRKKQGYHLQITISGKINSDDVALMNRLNCRCSLEPVLQSDADRNRARLLQMADRFGLTEEAVREMPQIQVNQILASYAAEQQRVAEEQQQALFGMSEALRISTPSAEAFYQAVDEMSAYAGVSSLAMLRAIQSFANDFWQAAGASFESITEAIKAFAEAIKQTEFFEDMIDEQRNGYRSKIRRQRQQRVSMNVVRAQARERQQSRPLPAYRIRRF